MHQEKRPGRPLSVVLLGAGKMARHHATAIQRLNGIARVVGYADPSAEARASMAEIVPSAEAVEDPYQLLDVSGADTAHICVPPVHHFELARAALEAGLNLYVEKPFTATEREAGILLDLAEERDLKVCAGHQLLSEAPTSRALETLPALRSVVHIESFFSFRTVRRTADGRAPLAPHHQLLDILPHPVYLLVRFLEEAAPGDDIELSRIEVGAEGTIHAFLRAGECTGVLVVTLTGRPVENYLRVVGANGSMTIDYVRGTVRETLGPGVSGVDKALNPFREARQLLFGTTSALASRVWKRQRSYPGLQEIFEAFYHSVLDSTPPPVSRRNILTTTRICEAVGNALDHSDSSGPSAAVAEAAGRTVVTGGTGFLGDRIVRALRNGGRPVTVVARRTPAPWERVEGVDYVIGDLAEAAPTEALAGADALIHCAAATAGGWEAHQEDSINATVNVLDAAAASDIQRVVHISSLAVQEAPDNGEAISEDSPLVAEPRGRGPYVWGKLESEKLARESGAELGLDVKVVRPGALLDARSFEPPGRLGRRIGNIFVAVGSRSDRIGVCDVDFAADAIAWIVRNWRDAPQTLNLLDPELPTRKELVQRLRKSAPEVRVLWLPGPILKVLSAFAVVLQKIIRPRSPALNLSRIFATESYDTASVQALAGEAVRGAVAVEEADR